MTPRSSTLAWVASIAAASVIGCSQDIEIGRNQAHSVAQGGSATGGDTGEAGSPSSGASGLGGASGTAGMGGVSGTETGGASGTAGTGGGDCQVTSCDGKTFACGNCDDDDGDAAVDSDDIYCTGPCDDDEASFGIGGNANTPSCKFDCFFDGDNGAGNDGCHWSARCDPVSAEPDFPPTGDEACAYDDDASIPGTSASCAELREAQDPMCEAACGPLVPNGCDCFGCCELPAASGRFIWLGSGSLCVEDALDDPALCRPCTRVAACTNPCDACEICAGRTTLDVTCSEATTCPSGFAACSEFGPRCSPGTYCITGCCVPVP
jgi:hypothetical protein